MLSCPLVLDIVEHIQWRGCALYKPRYPSFGNEFSYQDGFLSRPVCDSGGKLKRNRLAQAGRFLRCGNMYHQHAECVRVDNLLGSLRANCKGAIDFTSPSECWALIASRKLSAPAQMARRCSAYCIADWASTGFLRLKAAATKYPANPVNSTPRDRVREKNLPPSSSTRVSPPPACESSGSPHK